MAALTTQRSAPLHYQIQRILRAKIASGEWDGAARIPTELELMERFHVSRTTIRQALLALRDDGLIVRRPRHGTFVSADRATQRRRPVITNAVLGYEAEIRLVTCEEGRPPREATAFLGLRTDESVCRFLRLEAIGTAPLCVVINYLPVDIGRRLSLAALRRKSMLELLQKTLRIRLGRVEQSLEARLPDDRVAALLEIRLTEPVLFSRLLVSDIRGRPIQVVDAFYRSDRMSYKVAFPYLPRLGGGTWREPATRESAGPADAAMPRLEVRPPM